MEEHNASPASQRGKFWAGMSIGVAVGLFVVVPATLVVLGRDDSFTWVLTPISLLGLLVALPGILLQRSPGAAKRTMGKGMLVSIPVAMVLGFGLIVVIVVAALNAAFGS